MDPDAHTPSPWSARAGWLGVAALVAVGVALRLPLLELGYTSDEVGTVTDASFWSILDHPETGVNPPLWRWMWNVPFAPWDAPWWGRRFSFACSVLAIPAAYLVGRKAGRRHVLAGLAAAALLTLHPWVVRYAGVFRIYAWWSLTMLVHLGAMGAVLEREGRARGVAMGVAVGTAVLLPWIHYFSVPVLAVVGASLVLGHPGHRRLVGLYVPAAVGVLPLVPYVLFEEGRRVAPDVAPLYEVVRTMGSLSLHPPHAVWNTAGRAVARLTGTWPPLGDTMMVSVLLLLAAVVVGWRRASPTLRLTWAATTGVLLGVLVLGQAQYVRPTTLVMVVTVAAPTLAAVPTLLRHAWARTVGVLVVVYWFGARLPERFAAEQAIWEVEEASPILVARHRAWDARRGDRPILVHPMHRIWTVYFHLAHDVPRTARGGEACEGYSPCFVHDGIAWAGIREMGDGHLLDGLVVHLEAYRPEGLGSACDVVVDSGTWAVFDCRPAPVPPEDPAASPAQDPPSP